MSGQTDLAAKGAWRVSVLTDAQEMMREGVRNRKRDVSEETTKPTAGLIRRQPQPAWPCFSRFSCRMCFAFSSSRLRAAERPLPPRLMKYWIMRIPEPIPLGLTFLLSIAGNCRGVLGEEILGRERGNGLHVLDPFLSRSAPRTALRFCRPRFGHRWFSNISGLCRRLSRIVHSRAAASQETMRAQRCRRRPSDQFITFPVS